MACRACFSNPPHYSVAYSEAQHPRSPVVTPPPLYVGCLCAMYFFICSDTDSNDDNADMVMDKNGKRRVNERQRAGGKERVERRTEESCRESRDSVEETIKMKSSKNECKEEINLMLAGKDSALEMVSIS